MEGSDYWNLNENKNFLEPLRFSNGKNQKDIVKETVDLIRGGTKIVFIQGACGTGKSAIALNIARILGRASIVVPVKSLQKQYEEDYTDKKYVLRNGKKMKISVIKGRDNYKSIIRDGSCADPLLPDNIQITERNAKILVQYYMENPLIQNKVVPDISRLRRVSIAPANPYWSPIVPSVFELPLRDAKKIKYRGLRGRSFTFYHRKKGCGYYDQYESYIDSDVIIFNSAKYKIEVMLDRKPETDVEIIDEADEFLDSFSAQIDINLSRLASSLSNINCESQKANDAVKNIIEMIKLEILNKKALGADERAIFHVKDTKIEKILRIVNSNIELQAEIEIDENSYANKILEAAGQFIDFLDETYICYKIYEDDLYASLITINLSKKFGEIVSKSKALVLMSGTLHSEKVLRDIFGLKDFRIIRAEEYGVGSLDIIKTGQEFDCKHFNFKSGKNTREQYLRALSSCINKAVRPILVHVNSFEDLPSEIEKKDSLLNIHKELISREKLRYIQDKDKEGRLISEFKDKKFDILFSTKCSRGVDFPGDKCNSIIFTKYPNPNINDNFWTLLQKTYPSYFWEFYKDKAKREFLQRVYRALRFKEDHVYVLSPDSRVFDAARELQILADSTKRFMR